MKLDKYTQLVEIDDGRVVLSTVVGCALDLRVPVLFVSDDEEVRKYLSTFSGTEIMISPAGMCLVPIF